MRITQGWEGDGDMTLPEYMAFIKETDPKSAGNDTCQDLPDGYGKTVDVSGRDMSHLDGVDDALGLVGKKNDKTITFEEIRDKVKVVDQKRDKDFAATGALEIVGKLFAELTNGNDNDNDNNGDEVVNNTEEELEKIAKRRSSLISVEYLERELHRSSLPSIDNEKKKMTKTRRSSLIKTGKIE